MAKKNILSSGVVYSTDKNFKLSEDKEQEILLSPGEQKLVVRLDTRHRGGKSVTIVEGYTGADIEETGKKLKVYCGTGGSVKEGMIIIQGDNRQKIMEWLIKYGFKNVKNINR